MAVTFGGEGARQGLSGRLGDAGHVVTLGLHVCYDGMFTL